MERSTLGLSPAEIATFTDMGYLVVEGVLSDATLQPVIDEVTREVTARAQMLVDRGELRQTYAELGFERQLTAIDAEAPTLVPALSSGALSGTAFFDLITHPTLLDLGESLCGPELIASSVYRLRPKLPGDRRGEVPWHQDSGYFAPVCDRDLIVTVWIPLVDATLETGCLYVLPGVHRHEVLPHRPNVDGTYLQIDDCDLPPGAEAIPLNKGGVLLLTNRTPHASFENRSGIVRWSMDLRYQGADLPNNAPSGDEIARFDDGAMKEEGLPVAPACYPPARDLLVRSRQRPEDVVSDAHLFHELRVRHRASFDAASAIATPAERRNINPFSLQRWESE